MVPEEDPWYTLVPPRFQPRSEAYDGTASPHGYHTEKKTHVVWPHGQNGRDSWHQRILTGVHKSDWSRPAGHPYTSWMATLKSDLSLHNLTFKDAIELALDKSLWRLLVASGAMHWHGACRIMMMIMICAKNYENSVTVDKVIAKIVRLFWPTL